MSELRPSNVILPKFPGLQSSRNFRSRLFELDESHHPHVKTLAESGEWFFRRAANNERTMGTKLILSGPAGCGKTHVAKRLHRELGAWGVDMRTSGHWPIFPYTLFWDFARLAEIEKQDEFEEIMHDFRQAEIIFLDDVGSEANKFRSDEACSRLRRVLATAEGKWLLLTTNLPQEQFYEHYDARIADRLSAAHWCNLDIPSYRPKLK